MFSDTDVNAIFDLLKMYSDGGEIFSDNAFEVRSRIKSLVATIPAGVKVEDISASEPWVNNALRLHIADVFMHSEAFLIGGESPLEFVDLFTENNQQLYEIALTNTVHLASALIMCSNMIPLAKELTSISDEKIDREWESFFNK